MMTMGELFIMATKTKMKFPFKGQASVEDLWELSVENLDQVFKSLNAEKKQVSEESLLQTKSKEDEELDAKIEIVKYIVADKLKEAEAKKNEKEKRVQKQRLMEILAAKQDEALQNKTPEELQEMIDALGAK